MSLEINYLALNEFSVPLELYSYFNIPLAASVSPETKSLAYFYK